MEKPFPAIPEDLLLALEERFRDRAPDISWTEREVWRHVGEVGVVRFLRAEFSEQNETVIQR
jgi:hypothetical protein